MSDEKQKDGITYFAETDARNKRIKFGIRDEDRLRHIYTIGKTGMGKSTLLENMVVQDIQNGEGCCFVDPHGKTAELLLEFIPDHRIKDVVYFAPFDIEYPISFNVLEKVSVDKRHLVISGLMSAFEKIWIDAWSARMAYILQNTLAALLEYDGATMLSINRMLSDKNYRKKVVDNVTDPTVKSFWNDEFAKYTERFAAEATPAIQNKVGQFVSNSLIRNIIGQEHTSFDLRRIMDEKKILLVNLSKGLVGENNANLLGAMLVTKIYLAAMSRADRSQDDLRNLPNFYLYVDEFQSFANKSFADILSEARKYKLGLNITHQYVEQMSDEVRAAVFGNVGTMITFRVGSFDAAIFEKEFAPTFTMEDIVNLGFAQIYLKLMINNVASQPFSAVTLPPIEKPEVSYKEAVIAWSRERYSKPKAEVEEIIAGWHGGEGDKSAVRPVSSPIQPPSASSSKVEVVSPEYQSKRRDSASLDLLHAVSALGKRPVELHIESSEERARARTAKKTTTEEHSSALLSAIGLFKKTAPTPISTPVSVAEKDVAKTASSQKKASPVETHSPRLAREKRMSNVDFQKAMLREDIKRKSDVVGVSAEKEAKKSVDEVPEDLLRRIINGEE